MINRSQLEGVHDKIARAREAGAEVLLGGDPSGPAGRLLPPHVILGGNDVATAAEEVFGPVVTVIRADDAEHALAIANDTELGLSSTAFGGRRRASAASAVNGRVDEFTTEHWISIQHAPREYPI